MKVEKVYSLFKAKEKRFRDFIQKKVGNWNRDKIMLNCMSVYVPNNIRCIMYYTIMYKN